MIFTHQIIMSDIYDYMTSVFFRRSYKFPIYLLY